MKSNLPVKYNNNIFYKITDFIKNLFMKNKDIPVESDIEKRFVASESKNIFGKEKLKNEILDMIDANPDVIENLSINRLDELIKLYDEKIIENDKQIRYLRSKII